ncbi:MAG: GLPGLI family protein [Chitinophagaceae bacterium]|nr:MAG: GLPGLI family protein [Chitinophagaceae bacterium]
MKRLLFPCLAVLLAGGLSAQQKEGKVIYLRTVQMQMTFATGNGEPQTQTQTRTNKFELNFANNQMSWKQMEDEIQDENVGGGNMVFRTIGAGPDDVTFCDFSQAKRVEQRDFMDKQFLITDSIQKNTWKLTEETKTILNHLCRKATSQRIGKRMTMGIQNGKMERKEVDDTASLIAWFTTDIPVPVGPEVQGQLPGIVLEYESNGGRTNYKALEIIAKPDMSAIKEPTKGKKVTRTQFQEETRKMMEEMQRNGGGQFRMRAN